MALSELPSFSSDCVTSASQREENTRATRLKHAFFSSRTLKLVVFSSQTCLLVSNLSSSRLSLSQTRLNLFWRQKHNKRKQNCGRLNLTRLNSLKNHPDCLPPSHHPLRFCFFCACTCHGICYPESPATAHGSN